jgi:hypothetical protein
VYSPYLAKDPGFARRTEQELWLKRLEARSLVERLIQQRRPEGEHTTDEISIFSILGLNDTPLWLKV